MLKIGRFGPYVEETAQDKPRRSSLPKGWQPADLDLEKALRLLSLPRAVGADPRDGQPILAGLGRYGPYVQHGKTYASLSDIEEVFEVGLNRAVTLIAEKRAGGGRPQRGQASALKDLGAHPETGEPVRVLSGRFGPYIASRRDQRQLAARRGADGGHHGAGRGASGRTGGQALQRQEAGEEGPARQERPRRRLRSRRGRRKKPAAKTAPKAKKSAAA